jgi:hypothetical protein
MTGERPRPEEPEPRLDVDAAFAEIVAHWEPTRPAPESPEEPAATEELPEPTADPERLSGLFRSPWSDSLDDEATWSDEGHFVPPPPPPLPPLDPRRKLAWGALLGTPALALLLLVIGWGIPRWVLVGMVAAFVGGFCYLVATMSSSGHDGWSGGDGAVV